MKPFIKLTAFVLLVGMMFHLSCKKEYSCEGCADNNKNKPPISVAGPDQVITLPTDSVSLDSRSSSDQCLLCLLSSKIISDPSQKLKLIFTK
jgi:hypothetical protein